MALTGTLKDFGIAEILQLIGTQKKTGLLTLEDRQHRAEIEFAEGMVVGARGGTEGVKIEERLTRSELITPAQRVEAERKVQETLKPFNAVLLSENMVDPQALRETIALHISEIVFETFGWKSGTYAFEQKFIQWDKQLVAPMSAESIMMEGLRIVDETPAVMKLVSMDEKYVPSRKMDIDRTLGRESQRIFDLLDGQMTVKDVILRVRMPRFEVLKLFARMINNGMISPAANGAAALPPDPPVEKPGKQLNRMTAISVYILLGVTSLVALWQVARTVWNSAHLFTSSEETTAASQYMGEVKLTRIRNALDTYRLLKGAYPETLQSLVEVGLLKYDDLIGAGGVRFDYNPNGQSYQLLNEQAKPQTGANAAGNAPAVEESHP